MWGGFPEAEINGKALTPKKAGLDPTNAMIFPCINQTLQFRYNLGCPYFALSATSERLLMM